MVQDPILRGQMVLDPILRDQMEQDPILRDQMEQDPILRDQMVQDPILRDQMHELFLLFLLIYLMTLTWNLLILVLILTDLHLHTPMYFFLGNLACLDICLSSVTAPRIIYDLHTQSLRISKTACICQIFFFLFFMASEVLLLAIMSCDRYVAICRPLHYMQIMQWKVCTNMAFGVWIIGIAYSMVYALCTLRLNFCGSNVIHSFFCDLPQLMKISCSDISINNMLLFLLGGFYAFTCFVITFFPYVNIFSTVLRIRVKNKRLKAFSTCASHLTVVFILYGTSVFNYFGPSTHIQEDTPVTKSFCWPLCLVNDMLPFVILYIISK
ncbi:olfactory receptor 1C1-like [Discoglossus pictus]